MLENAVKQWPEEDWQMGKKFFYITYHTLVFLDYYLTTPPPGIFTSPLPFKLIEPADTPAEALDDIIPDRIYTKTELLSYLGNCREKCYTLVHSLTEEQLSERWIEADGQMNYALLEILLYNMRHVQHHAAQLNMMLRERMSDAPRWVGCAKDTN